MCFCFHIDQNKMCVGLNSHHSDTNWPKLQNMQKVIHNIFKHLQNLNNKRILSEPGDTFKLHCGFRFNGSASLESISEFMYISFINHVVLLHLETEPPTESLLLLFWIFPSLLSHSQEIHVSETMTAAQTSRRLSSFHLYKMFPPRSVF